MCPGISSCEVSWPSRAPCEHEMNDAAGSVTGGPDHGNEQSRKSKFGQQVAVPKDQ